MKLLAIFILFIFLTCISCSAIRETSKQQMETGIYKVPEENNKHFYTVVEEDKITLHPAVKRKEGWIANTDTASIINLSATTSNKRSIRFITRSFDLDVLTILFKYRPVASGFPPQLNSNFNAAGFLGHRSDYYLLSYAKDPLNAYQRHMNHFAYSLGFFGGLGATNMNPFVTNNRLQSEYDGVVLTKGIAGLILCPS